MDLGFGTEVQPSGSRVLRRSAPALDHGLGPGSAGRCGSLLAFLWANRALLRGAWLLPLLLGRPLLPLLVLPMGLLLLLLGRLGWLVPVMVFLVDLVGRGAAAVVKRQGSCRC